MVNLEDLEQRSYKEHIEKAFFRLINRLDDKQAYEALKFEGFQECTE